MHDLPPFLEPYILNIQINVFGTIKYWINMSENRIYHIYKITGIVRQLAQNVSPHDTYFVICKINTYYVYDHV
jgi:hypothetical protein